MTNGLRRRWWTEEGRDGEGEGGKVEGGMLLAKRQAKRQAASEAASEAALAEVTGHRRSNGSTVSRCLSAIGTCLSATVQYR